MQNIPYQVCTIYKQCTSNKTHTSSAQHSDMSGKEGRKEENVLFNDALNTFYFMVIWHQTYGKGPFT